MPWIWIYSFFFLSPKIISQKNIFNPFKIITQLIQCGIFRLRSRLTLWFLPGVWSPDCLRCDQRILCCWWRQGVWHRGPSECFSAECGSGRYIQHGSRAVGMHLHASAWIHSSWDPTGYESKGEISRLSIYLSTSTVSAVSMCTYAATWDGYMCMFGCWSTTSKFHRTLGWFSLTPSDCRWQILWCGSLCSLGL